MKKSLLVIFMVLFLFIVFSGGSTYAQFGEISEYSPTSYLSMLMLNDWQMDYLMPVDPAELNQGEYRVYGNAASLNVSSYNNDDRFNGGLTKSSGTNYIVGFDTALRDDLYFHISYDMVPWQAPQEDEKDEIRFGMVKMFLDYEFDQDKKVYFGYNNNSYGYKEFDEDANTFLEEETTDLNVFYVGFEIKSSFNR